MTIRDILAVSFACVALSGCTFFNNLVNPNPNVVATMESTLAAADDAAVPYISLPSCVKSAAPCRDPGLTKKLDVARAAAYIAVTTAESNETASAVTAAENAIAAYTAITNTLNQ